MFATACARCPPRAATGIRAIRLAQRPAGLAASLRGAGQGAMEPLFDRLPVDRRADARHRGRARRPRRERAPSASPRGIPGARLVVVDGAGHTPHLEQPDALPPPRPRLPAGGPAA